MLPLVMVYVKRNSACTCTALSHFFPGRAQPLYSAARAVRSEGTTTPGSARMISAIKIASSITACVFFSIPKRTRLF